MVYRENSILEIEGIFHKLLHLEAFEEVVNNMATFAS